MKNDIKSYKLAFCFPLILSYCLMAAQISDLPKTDVTDWEEMVSYDGRFRILSPGNLTAKQDTVQTPIGPLVYHTHFYHADDDQKENYVYMLSYCDYPAFTMHSDSTELIEEFFATTIDAAVSSVNGVLMYSTDTDLSSFPGKLWRIDYLSGQGIIKTKAVVVRNRYYAIQTVTRKGMGLNRSSDLFLDSFRLLE